MSQETDLYRHYDGNGRLLYVGISLSAINRMSNHKQTSGWSKLVATIKIERYNTRKEALDAEARAIQEENPPYNKVGKGKTARPYSAVKVHVRIPGEDPLKDYIRRRGLKMPKGLEAA